MLDEDAVLRAYARHRSVIYVAKAMSADDGTVRAILDKHGVPHSASARVRATAVQNGHTRAGRVQPATGPSSADLLKPARAEPMPDVQSPAPFTRLFDALDMNGDLARPASRWQPDPQPFPAPGPASVGRRRTQVPADGKQLGALT